MIRSVRTWPGIACTSSDVTASGLINTRGVVMGVVEASSTETVTSLTVYGIVGSSTGSRRPLYDQDGVAAVLTVAGNRITELPTAIAACDFIAFLPDAGCTVNVTLKS